jgi:acyl-coenzyme A thioesterase PaaI-like protein
MNPIPRGEEIGVNLRESAAELESRTAMARALQQLGHALMSHRLDPDSSERITRMAEEALRVVQPLPERDRVTELAEDPRFTVLLSGERHPQAAADGEIIDLFRDSIVSGRTNPMGIGLTIRREGDAAVGSTVLGAAFEGAPRRAHGGIIAAIVDEVMGHLLPIVGVVAYTAKLSIDYLAAAPLGVPLTFSAWPREHVGRKLWVDARGFTPDGIFVRAEALFLCVDVAHFAQSGNEATQP